jgi:peptidoglycan/LPS O-acetylase OafA/YrhL
MSHGLTTFLGVPLLNAAGAIWVFFVISGFLITIALSGKYSSGHLAGFYWNRLIRLYPAYWVWLVLTILAYVHVPAEYLKFQEWQASVFWADHAGTSSAATLVVAIVANITGLFSDSMLSLSVDSGILVPQTAASAWAMAFMFIGQFWSIGVELCFYALAPFLTKSLWRISALFFFSSSGYFEKALTIAGTWADLPAVLLYLRAPTLFWMFMLGALLGHIYLRGQTSRSLMALAAPVGLLLAMYAYVASRGSALFPMQAFPWWLFAILTASLPVLFAKTASNKFDRFAGDLSYPVYINHFIIIQLVGTAIGPNGFVFALVSVLLATATIFLIERPARRLKWAPTVGKPCGGR